MTELSMAGMAISAMAHFYEVIIFFDNKTCAGQVFCEGEWKVIESFDSWCGEYFPAIYKGDDIALFMQKICSETLVKLLETEDEYVADFSTEGRRRKRLTAFSAEEKGTFVCIKDITAGFKKEQERAKLTKESLEVAQHAFLAMERLGTGIYEDIKRPVLQALEVLEKAGGKNREEAQEYIKYTRKILDDYLSTLDSMLAFSKPEKGGEGDAEDVIIVCDFVTEIRKMSEMISEMTERHISLQDNTKNVTAFWGNCVCLKQLLGSAFSALISGSTDRSLNVVLDFIDDKLRFVIATSGTEDSVMKNNYIKQVNSLTSFVGGQLLIETRKSTEEIVLTIEIPAKRAEHVHYRKAKLEARMKDHILDRDFSAFRALVVDDDDVSREIIVSKIKQFGLCVEEASDGEEAMQKLLASPGRYYHIVFTKMLLLKKSGLDMTMELRELVRRDLNDITVVAVTANPMKDKRLTALEHGMDYHLPLPLNDFELKEIFIRELENIGPEENKEKFGFRIIK